MRLPKPVGELLTGYLALAVAAIVVAVALQSGRVTGELIAAAVGLLVLAVALALLSARALGDAFAGLLRALERLARIALPGWRWNNAGDLDSLVSELNAMTPRLRDRLEELTEDRDRAGQILDALDDGILLLDGAGRLLVTNPTARAWFGLPEDLRPGLPLRRVIGVAQIAELAEEATAKKAPVTGTITVVLPEHRTLVLRAFPLADRGPTGRTVVTLSDITQRRRLAALRALSETLESALPDDPDVALGFVTRISREAERLDALVRDLLDLSRLERGTLDAEPVDMVGLVKEVAETYSERANERRIRLRTELRRESMVRGDRAQLGLLLSNLVDNALRYTGARGTVRIRLDSIDDKVILQVADTGKGIPASELPRIFERFYRVDKARARRTGGTGLGLAIVRHVAESHGGTVAVESKVGRGTTFSVTIPVTGPSMTTGA